MKNGYDFATLAVHAGEAPCPVTGALDTPIYQSTTFVSADSDEMAAVYGDEKFGYMYTRYGNPTIHALEEKMTALEAGEAALATASGMAAISTAILAAIVWPFAATFGITGLAWAWLAASVVQNVLTIRAVRRLTGVRVYMRLP